AGVGETGLLGNGLGPCPHGGVDCASGFCADGVCCDRACQGPCVSCKVPLRVGVCTPVAALVADPRGICIDAPPCGTNGTCDGSGGCMRYPVGAVCAAAYCQGSTLFPLSTCDARGSCVAPTPLDCAPYACDAVGLRCDSGCAGGDAICIS